MTGCGTTAGYHKHSYHQEKPCAHCKAAWNAYCKVLLARRGRQLSTLVPFWLLGVLLRTAPAEAVTWAEEELSLGAVAASVEAAQRVLGDDAA